MRRRRWIAGPFALALAASVLAGCTESPDATGPAAPTVAPPSAAVISTTSTTDVPVDIIPDVTGAATAITNDGLVFGDGKSVNFCGCSKDNAWVWDGTGSPQLLEGTVTDLNRGSEVKDSNQSGQAVGFVEFSTGSTAPFIWDADNGFQFIDEPYPSRGNGEAWGITETGGVAGRYLPSTEPERSFYWEPGMTYAEDIDLSFRLARDAGGDDIIVLGSIIWMPDGTTFSLNGSATATNGNDFAGRARNADGVLTAALIYETAAPLFLGTLGGPSAYPHDINSDGWVVGYSEMAEGLNHAFVWTPETGMVDLGTLEPDGGSAAFAINDHGEIAGTADGQAVIWTFDPGSSANQPPEIEAIISQTVEAGETLEVTPVVTDPEGDPYTLTWDGLPPNAIANEIFTFTPTLDQVGETYVVTVTATQDSDPSLSDSEGFAVDVLAPTEATADLQVSLVAQAGGQMLMGQEVLYTASIYNAGPDAVENVTLTIEPAFHEQTEWGTLPPDAIVNGVFPDQPPPIGPGETYDVEFGLLYQAFGVHAIAATVTGDYVDANVVNDAVDLEQIIDLPLNHPDVANGTFTVDGALTTDGLPLTLVGVGIPGHRIVGDWPDVIVPASLTPGDILGGDALLPAVQAAGAGELLPAEPSLAGSGFTADHGHPTSGQLVLWSEAVSGDLSVPPEPVLDPPGRLLFADGDGVGTDVLLTDRPVDGAALVLADEVGDGIRLTASGGTLENTAALCDGTFDVAVDDGDAAILTCGSLTAEILSGEIVIELMDGTLVFVPAGAMVRITEDGAGGWDVEVLAGGPVDIVPPATFSSLRDAIDELLADGTLNRGLHNALTRKAEQAARLVQREKPGEAVEVLGDLRQQVFELEEAGWLSADQRDVLVVIIDGVIEDLTG